MRRDDRAVHLLALLDDSRSKIAAQWRRPLVPKPKDDFRRWNCRHVRKRRHLVGLETSAELAGEPRQHAFDRRSEVDFSIRAGGYSDQIDAIAIGKEK